MEGKEYVMADGDVVEFRFQVHQGQGRPRRTEHLGRFDARIAA